MNFNNFSGNDWQNFSYLAVLLCFLIIGFFSRKEIATKQILKYFFIWLGVAILLVSLYSYRYEFSNLKNRLTSEINPANPKINQLGQIVINVSEDGHFYVNSKVNGVAVRFMIDTGASDITINLNDAQRIGIEKQSLNFNRRYQTANGMALGASVTLNEIEIAEIKFTNVKASVNSANMGVSLLGISFLKQLKKYEVFQDKLILTIN